MDEHPAHRGDGLGDDVELRRFTVGPRPGPGRCDGPIVAWALLPRSLGQTLAALLRGLSEKQVAGELGLSQHTVHGYIKLLHRRLRVSSRSELILAGLALAGAPPTGARV